MGKRVKVTPTIRGFKGRAPGRQGDWVAVILNANTSVAVAVSGWVIRSNKKGFTGLVVHSWTHPLIQGLEPVDDCLMLEISIPNSSILAVTTLPVQPEDCRCAHLRTEREWGDDDD